MCSDGPVLVFDGVCVLCNRSVQFVLRHDHACRYRFASNESVSGRDLMLRHGLDPTAPASVLLVEGDFAYRESAAVVRILASFGGGWWVLATVLRVVPAVLRNYVYRAIALRRYRWFGRYETCMVPSPEEAARFLL